MNPIKQSLLGRLELAFMSMNYSQIDVEQFSIHSDEHHIITGVYERGTNIYVRSKYVTTDPRRNRRESRVEVQFLDEDVLEKLTVLLEGIRHKFIQIQP